MCSSTHPVVSWPPSATAAAAPKPLTDEIRTAPSAPVTARVSPPARPAKADASLAIAVEPQRECAQERHLAEGRWSPPPGLQVQLTTRTVPPPEGPPRSQEGDPRRCRLHAHRCVTACHTETLDRTVLINDIAAEPSRSARVHVALVARYRMAHNYRGHCA